MDIIPQDIPQKQCAGPCKRLLPATTEFFHRNKLGKYGLDSTCKSCTKARNKEWRERPGNKEHQSEYGKAYRGQPEISERYRVYNAEHRKLPEIQAHRKAYYEEYKSRPGMREYEQIRQKAYLQRPEIKKQRKANRKVYNSRPEIKENQQTYGYTYRNREDIKAREKVRAKVYRIDTNIQAKERAYRKEYLQREHVKERYRVHTRNRTAIKKQVGGTYTPEQIQEQLKRQKYCCYYAACGFAKFAKVNGKYVYHIEHTYPLSRAKGTDIPANDISYIVLACPSCNQSKGDKLPHEWIDGGRLL